MEVVLMLLIGSAAGAYKHSEHVDGRIEIFKMEYFSYRQEESMYSDGCLGAPFLYVTLHDESRNILKYTRDGCFISDQVLVGGPTSDMSFRSMVINDSGDLFLANAADSYSQLLQYGSCTADDNSTAGFNGDQKITTNSSSITAENMGGPGISASQRVFKGIVADVRSNPGVEHPYGLTLDSAQAYLIEFTRAYTLALANQAFIFFFTSWGTSNC